MTEPTNFQFLKLKRSIPYLNLSTQFDMYKRVTDLNSSGELADPFLDHPIDAVHFFNSYISILRLISDLGLEVAILELSFFVMEEELKDEGFLLTVINENENILNEYIKSVRLNIDDDFKDASGPIIHHPDLDKSPYYYKVYDSSIFRGQKINTNNFRPKYKLGKYNIDTEKFAFNGQDQLNQSISAFFDRILRTSASFSEKKSETNNEYQDVALLLPLPRPGESFKSQYKLSGGGIFLFGSIKNVTLIPDLIVKLRQFLHESILQQTVFNPVEHLKGKAIEKDLAHFLKNSIQINIIDELEAIEIEDNESRRSLQIKELLEFSKSLTKQIAKYLRAIKLVPSFIQSNVINQMIIDVCGSYNISDIQINVEVETKTEIEIFAELGGVEIILHEIIDNAIKAMNRFWRSGEATGTKSIFVKSQFSDGHFEVRIYNSGTVFPEEEIETVGKRHPSDLSKGSTGWGHTIIRNSLRKMNALRYSNQNFILIKNIVKSGVEVSFQLRIRIK